MGHAGVSSDVVLDIPNAPQRPTGPTDSAFVLSDLPTSAVTKDPREVPGRAFVTASRNGQLRLKGALRRGRLRSASERMLAQTALDGKSELG